MSLLEGSQYGVFCGRLWMTAEYASDAVRESTAKANAWWEKTIADQAEHHTREIERLNKRIVEEQERWRTVQLQWQAAEERCGKLDRAEEAMREYEQTIGDQRKEIERLKRLIPKTKKAETKTAPHPYSIEATAQQLAERLKKVNKSTI